jgi:lipopolysaccharide transport system ATP-binding protein
MADLAIQAAGLGKQYRTGVVQEHYITLRDTIANAAHAWTRVWARSRTPRGRRPTFWALKDISFDVRQGEVVGIIGQNGAGKSTLLKILSRITEPTEGYADIRGRVGSLLEVGTGFHPELTGRENIQLSGAILGMRYPEIMRKFEEIVAFAEIDAFIDTPVKHYSSGMYLRLAFAVAAHLEPEILLVDEVLAVGDARFQRKCLAKMQDVGQSGRTVLFVSHSMPAITRLCERAIWLHQGKLAADGHPHRVVSTYLSEGQGTVAVREWPDLSRAPGSDVVRLCAVRIRSEEGQVADAVDIRRPVGVELEYEVFKPGHVLQIYYRVRGPEGVVAFIAMDQDPQWRGRPRHTGRYLSTGWIPGNLLSEGTMFIGAGIQTVEPFIVHVDQREAVVAFEVIDCPGGETARGDYARVIPGAVRPLLRWETEFYPSEPATVVSCGQMAPQH